MRLKGKVALVTGAGQGIGRAIALAFAKEGADVAVNAFHQETSEATTADIRKLGRRAVAVPADVSIADDVDAMVDKALDALGRIDILVNNAGGTRSLFPVLDYPPEEWDLAVDVNLRGPFLCSRRVGRLMAKQRAGKILNIASITAYAGVPLRGAYGPAKAGVINMTMVMAVELGKYNINVNCIAPGAVMVPRTLRLAEEGGFDMDGAKAQSPLGKLCEPDDVAKAAVFLVSEDAGKITGVTLPVDAGWLANRTLT